MDPIHPILPQPPNIPPVTEAPRVGRIDRDQRRGKRDEDEHGNARGKTGTHRGSGEFGDESDPGAEPHPHIDVTA